MSNLWSKSSYCESADCVEFTRSSYCAGDGCVEIGFRKSNFSGANDCVEVGFAKSSYSTAGACGEVDFHASTLSNGDACVEVGVCPHQEVSLRDSKDIEGPILTFPGISWVEFVDGVRAGEFDL